MSSILKVDTIQTAAGGTPTAADLGLNVSGSVLQVVNATKTGTQSASLTSGAEADISGLSASITPTSTSSKILIMCHVVGHNDTEGGLGIKIARDGTMIVQPDSAGTYGDGKTHSANIGVSNTGISADVQCFLVDTPSTTSSTTYQAKMFNYASSTRTIYINRAPVQRHNSVSTLILMEIAG